MVFCLASEGWAPRIACSVVVPFAVLPVPWPDRLFLAFLHDVVVFRLWR
jgi:hypothetical protein